jgi:hypothetical protein
MVRDVSVCLITNGMPGAVEGGRNHTDPVPSIAPRRLTLRHWRSSAGAGHGATTARRARVSVRAETGDDARSHPMLRPGAAGDRSERRQGQ